MYLDLFFFFLLRGRNVAAGGRLAFWEIIQLPVWEKQLGLLLPCPANAALVRNITKWPYTVTFYKYERVYVFFVDSLQPGL